ncbi:MAG: Dihydropteroate synthase [Pseudomonadota bacterium]|jgi:dihydropteroate synthase
MDTHIDPSKNALHWQTSRFDLDLSQPKIMGIVNLTPDSFSDGGQFRDAPQALQHAEQLLKEGAHILDVGAESTRPGALKVPLELELARLKTFVLEAVRWQVPISVDTYKPEVMQAVLDWGVDIINDVWALRQPGAEETVAAHSGCGVCLMHMHRDPQTMQIEPMAGDVVSRVAEFLRDRLNTLSSMGVSRSRLVVDPGIGFGKTVAQNFQLLAFQSDLQGLGCPVLAGWSRKSALGSALAHEGHMPEPAQRQMASVAAALLAVERGAKVVRVHDVKMTAEALQIWRAMQLHAFAT